MQYVNSYYPATQTEFRYFVKHEQHSCCILYCELRILKPQRSKYQVLKVIFNYIANERVQHHKLQPQGPQLRIMLASRRPSLEKYHTCPCVSNAGAQLNLLLHNLHPMYHHLLPLTSATAAFFAYSGILYK